MRLQHYMAKSGIASRRKSESIILAGRVMVNNQIVDRLGVKVDPDRDIVHVDNRVIKMERHKIYIMLNKPVGYVTTMKNKHDQKIVLDLIRGVEERIFPVGRLDQDTSGLLLLTNDGYLAHRLTHPRYEITKVYEAVVRGIPNNSKLMKFRKGLKIDGRVTARAYVKVLKRYKDSSLLEIAIHEGRNRQVRKMCKYIGHPVIELKRISISGLALDDLPIGKWRYLTKDEVGYLSRL
ncbi:MAG: rRNA pseudouridine synthase [Tissierellia bacterium]|nr:rRNA pseudouridine synthase [Tissierellia bacterium]